MYELIEARGEGCGESLIGSGDHLWLSLDASLKQIEKHGYVLGRTCRYLEKYQGLLYYYGPGTEDGPLRRHEAYRIDINDLEYEATQHPTLISQPNPNYNSNWRPHLLRHPPRSGF